MLSVDHGSPVWDECCYYHAVSFLPDAIKATGLRLPLLPSAASLHLCELPHATRSLPYVLNCNGRQL